jgi:hypothetical protein
VRALFKRACQNLNEHAEPVCVAWLQYEREFGDLASEDAAGQWVASHRQRQAERLAHHAAKEEAALEEKRVRRWPASKGDTRFFIAY